MSGIPCDYCGKFMSYAEMEPGGGATFYFEPLNEFGPEVAEWTCKRCNEQQINRSSGSAQEAPESNS